MLNQIQQVMPGGVSVSKEVKLSDNWNQLVMSVNYPSIDNYILCVQDHTIKPTASVPSVLTNGTYRILDPASGASNLTRAGRVYFDADSMTLYYYANGASASASVKLDASRDDVCFSVAVTISGVPTA